MKEGEVGAEVFFSFLATMGREVLDPRRFVKDVAVLIPRFLRFLGFLAGVVGRCNSKKVLGELSAELFSDLRDRKSDTNDEGATLAMGDSGEGPGEGSVTDEESMVDIVVVGEESEDSEAKVDVLSR